MPKNDRAPVPDLCVPRPIALGRRFTLDVTFEFALIWYGQAVSIFLEIRPHFFLPIILILDLLLVSVNLV